MVSLHYKGPAVLNYFDFFVLDKSFIDKRVYSLLRPIWYVFQAKSVTDNSRVTNDDDTGLFDDWEEEVKSEGRICPGHERAIPIESFVTELDVKEEGKS